MKGAERCTTIIIVQNSWMYGGKLCTRINPLAPKTEFNESYVRQLNDHALHLTFSIFSITACLVYLMLGAKGLTIYL